MDNLDSSVESVGQPISGTDKNIQINLEDIKLSGDAALIAIRGYATNLSSGPYFIKSDLAVCSITLRIYFLEYALHGFILRYNL